MNQFLTLQTSDFTMTQNVLNIVHSISVNYIICKRNNFLHKLNLIPSKVSGEYYETIQHECKIMVQDNLKHKQLPTIKYPIGL